VAIFNPTKPTTVREFFHRPTKADTRSPATLPASFLPPHAAQQKMLEEAKRFNVADCGRREGKTELAKRLLAEPALRGGRTAYTPPIYPMAHQFYRELANDLAPLIVRKEENKRIELRGGGFIDFWSLENGGDRIRGQQYDRVVPDECAMVIALKRIWENVLRPTLTDRRGDAWFLSTPKRGSDFELFYGLGQDPDNDEWKSWKVPTAITRDGTATSEVIGTNNPYLVKDPDGNYSIPLAIAELERARQSMSSDAFATEYLADFEASDSDLVYPEFDRALHVRSAPCSWADYKWRVAGVDPGGGDPTAIVPIGVTDTEHLHQQGEFYKRGEVAIDDVVSYLSQLHNIAPFDMIVIDPSAKGWVEQLKRYGLPAYPAYNSRGAGLESVRFLLQQGRLSIGEKCQNSISEFAGYRWAKKRDQDTGERYATDTAFDHHADAMDARRYAVMAVLNGLPDARKKPVPIRYSNPRAMGWNPRRVG